MSTGWWFWQISSKRKKSSNYRDVFQIQSSLAKKKKPTQQSCSSHKICWLLGAPRYKGIGIKVGIWSSQWCWLESGATRTPAKLHTALLFLSCLCKRWTAVYLLLFLHSEAGFWQSKLSSTRVCWLAQKLPKTCRCLNTWTSRDACRQCPTADYPRIESWMSKILIPDVLQWDHSSFVRETRKAAWMTNFLLGPLGSGHLLFCSKQSI